MHHKVARRKIDLGIRDRLIVWLLVLGIVPVIGTSLLGYWAMNRTAIDTAGDRLTAVAERLANATDSELRLIVQSISGADPGFPWLSERLVTAGRHVIPEPTDSAAYVTAIMNHPAVTELHAIISRAPDRFISAAVADTTGFIIASTHPVASAVVADEEWWQTTWSHGLGATHIGQPRPTAETYMMEFGLPIRDTSGRVTGILRVEADIWRIADIIEYEIIGTTGITTITSADGTVLIHSALGLDPRVPGDRYVHFDIGRPKWYQGRGLLNQSAVVALAQVKTTTRRMNWFVTAEQSRSEILAPTRQFGSYAISIALFVVAAVMFVGLMLSKRIARPLVELRNGAQRIGAGDLDFRLDVRSRDEVGQLADEFNAMAARLREFYQGLEQRIREATSQLERERNSLEAIVAALGEGLMVIDPEHRIVMWNRAAETLTGFQAEDVIGRRCNELLEAEDAKHPRLCESGCPAATAVANGRVVSSYDMSTLINRRDGDRLPVAVTASPLVDANGRNRGCVVVLRDITREKELDRFKSETISTVSHELRSPLTAIIGFAEILEDSAVSEEKRRRYTRVIVTEGRRLAEMIDDYLTLSRIEAGRLDLVIDDINLREVVDEVLAVEAGPNPHHQLRCEIPADFPAVRADRKRFKRALHNLVSNAIKYSPDGGPVVVSVGLEGDAVIISVQDDGIGIKEKDLPRLFHRFQRVNREEYPEIRGTGLGLAITASIIKEHGWSIGVESRYGEGSTFSIRLPRRETLTVQHN